MENLTKSVSKRFNCIYTMDTTEKFASVKVLRTAYADSNISTADLSNHRHSFNEMHIILQGNADYLISDNADKYHISEKEYIIIPKKVEHQNLSLSDNGVRLVIAYEGTASDRDTPVSVRKLTSDVESTIWFLLSEKCTLGFFERYALITSVATQLSAERKINVSEQGEVGETKSPYASMITRYLNDNKMKCVTISDIVNYCCCCQRQLNRILNRDMNKNLNTLVSEHKLNLIAHYLQTTDIPLKEIALLTGFSNEYSMSRFFCKEMRTSPDKYRRYSQGSHPD